MSAIETNLEWPSFCYSTSLFEDSTKSKVVPVKTVKGRKKQEKPTCIKRQLVASKEKEVNDYDLKVSREDEQLVPQGPASLTQQPQRPRASQPPQEYNEQFAFSSLMRKMAQKYQNSSDTDDRSQSQIPCPPQAITLPNLPLNPLLLQAAFQSYLPFQLPVSSPFSSSQALTALANRKRKMFEESFNDFEAKKRSRVEVPLDLSRSQSLEIPEDDVIDVLSVDIPTSNLDRAETWSVDRVVSFVEKIESCQEYAQLFREHYIDGAALLELTEQHLTGILGLKLGPAMRLRSAIKEIQKRATTSTPSVSPSTSSNYSI